ncbi:hypothetical protein ROJ8625_00712 [Roseivivax jejudonensis]|uniref:Uncharacterized protein n=2 Tax=Roseivivax jejudonensis TaxID=1529041 RepID=A0A1X6YFP2_9RHOB|nr:hypothetical protein ROJ8625_00712 [Roseivivax jejudonensis]
MLDERRLRRSGGKLTKVFVGRDLETHVARWVGLTAAGALICDRGIYSADAEATVAFVSETFGLDTVEEFEPHDLEAVARHMRRINAQGPW